MYGSVLDMRDVVDYVRGRPILWIVEADVVIKVPLR